MDRDIRDEPIPNRWISNSHGTELCHLKSAIELHGITRMRVK